MKILILSHDDVTSLMPVADCIPVMRSALIALSDGKAFQPLRTIVRPPMAGGKMGLMPSYLGTDEPAYGLKALCLFEGNPSIGKDAHQGGVLLFSPDTGELLAVMNASAITAIRTAAVSGVATDLLAREDAGDLALIGASVQARTHLAAISAVRKIRRCRVAARRFENAQQFARAMQREYDFPIEAVATVEAAVLGSDIVATVTSSSTPVIKREWVSDGAHLNVVGSSAPTAREVDSATMAASSVFVDRMESALNEAGDYLFAARDGVVGPEDLLGEIGELLTGKKTGRATSDEITLFKSLGLAIEDLAAAQFLYKRATDLGAGAWVEFG